MKELKFIEVGELDRPPYIAFHELSEYEKEHPLHRLYEYVTQYFGGLREDVLEFFCDEASVNRLASLIEEGQDPGLKNEWYRRLVRLLQCNAEAGWYKMFCVKEEKPKGYVQYFLNQLASYAEMGVPAELVGELFGECDAAYLLEYKVRQAGKRGEGIGEERQLPAEWEEGETETTRHGQEKGQTEDVAASMEQLLQPILEGQKKVQDMLLLMLQDKAGKEERRGEREDTTENWEGGISLEEQTAACDEIQERETETEKADSKASEKEAEERREKAFRTANLFQKIRIKRKSVQLRKMDQKQQLQELIVKMTQEKFSTEDMGVVRGLIDHDVSLEFLYTVISEEKEPVRSLRQMYEFLSYQPDGCET